MEAAPDATATLPKNHSDTERHIVSLGMDWTFLRPNYYMQNVLCALHRSNQQFRFATRHRQDSHDRCPGRG